MPCLQTLPNQSSLLHMKTTEPLNDRVWSTIKKKKKTRGFWSLRHEFSSGFLLLCEPGQATSTVSLNFLPVKWEQYEEECPEV